MRVLVGRIFHESHSFNPVPTRSTDFTVLRGEALLDAAAGSTLGGIIKALQAAGAEPIPSLSATARPGGPVQHDVYAQLKAEILLAARRHAVDAVAFELHGAMTTDRLHDAEGDLLAALRTALGSDRVIGVGIDLHAHITPEMLSAADIVTACKQNPHADVVETGARTARLVLDTAAGRVKPATVLAKLPMLLPGGLETGCGPLAELHASARAWLKRRSQLLDISICNVHSYLDVPDLGQAIIVIADEIVEGAHEAAAQIAAQLWEARDRFSDRYPGIDEALELVMRRPERRPWVLADRGDRVLAGAPGDSTAILARLLQRQLPLRAAIPVTDPESVERARQAGIGSVVTLEIGGRQTPGIRPLTASARILSLTDGDYVMRGPYQGGQPSSLGPTALVQVGPHTIMLTSRAGLTQDPAAFTSQGIDLARHDLVVAKSGYHFKLSFKGVATPLVVDTPGLTNWRPGFFNYRHARPFYPEDAVEPGTAAQVFAKRART